MHTKSKHAEVLKSDVTSQMCCIGLEPLLADGLLPLAFFSDMQLNLH